MSHQTYAPLRTSFWTDPKVRTGLPGDGKYMATYWFSAPSSNLAGLFSCDYVTAAKHIDRPVEFVRFHTQVTCSPYVTYDEQTEEVFVHAAAKHRIGETIKEKDTRRRTLERLWKDCHSPYLRSAFAQKYEAWGLDLPGVLVPPGYKHVAPPLPLPPMGHGMGHTMGHTMPLSEAVAVDQIRSDGKETTANGAREFSTKPEYTLGQLMEAARKVCGLGLWDRREENSAHSVLQSLHGEGKTPERIWAAMHGARQLCDAGKVEWLKARQPFGLKVLRNQQTLYDQGDGRAVRPFFDVAEEAFNREPRTPRSRTRTPARLSVSVPEPPSDGHAA